MTLEKRSRVLRGRNVPTIARVVEINPILDTPYILRWARNGELVEEKNVRRKHIYNKSHCKTCPLATAIQSEINLLLEEEATEYNAGRYSLNPKKPGYIRVTIDYLSRPVVAVFARGNIEWCIDLPSGVADQYLDCRPTEWVEQSFEMMLRTRPDGYGRPLEKGRVYQGPSVKEQVPVEEIEQAIILASGKTAVEEIEDEVRRAILGDL